MIQVFYVPFRNNAYLLASLKEILNGKEIERANRFIFKLDQSKFIYFRAVLRGVLGNLISCHPKGIQFKYSSKGKPYLDPFYHKQNLYFNLSHSEMFALIAVSNTVRVGIDVEWSRPVPHLDGIMSSTLSLCEQKHVQSFPAEERSCAFLHHWTKKEAFLKGIGQGLECNLTDYTFGDYRNEVNDIVYHDSGKWTVQSILGLKNCINNIRVSRCSVNELCQLNWFQPGSARMKVEDINNQIQRYIAAVAYEGVHFYIRHIYVP